MVGVGAKGLGFAMGLLGFRVHSRLLGVRMRG